MPFFRHIVMVLFFCNSIALANPAPAEPLPESAVAAQWMGKLQGMGRETGAMTTRLVTAAMGLIGVPYRFGGTSTETGLDCSAFVRTVYEQTLGLVLPRRAAEQAQATESIPKDQLQPGDLVFFNTMRRAFSHVGIYIGDGKFIHSPRAGQSVRVEDMTKAYWVKRYNGASRVDTEPTLR